MKHALSYDIRITFVLLSKSNEILMISIDVRQFDVNQQQNLKDRFDSLIVQKDILTHIIFIYIIHYKAPQTLLNTLTLHSYPNLSPIPTSTVTLSCAPPQLFLLPAPFVPSEPLKLRIPGERTQVS